jgi:hypothetical protein
LSATEDHPVVATALCRDPPDRRSEGPPGLIGYKPNDAIDGSSTLFALSSGHRSCVACRPSRRSPGGMRWPRRVRPASRGSSTGGPPRRGSGRVSTPGRLAGQGQARHYRRVTISASWANGSRPTESITDRSSLSPLGSRTWRAGRGQRPHRPPRLCLRVAAERSRPGSTAFQRRPARFEVVQTPEDTDG